MQVPCRKLGLKAVVFGRAIKKDGANKSRVRVCNCAAPHWYGPEVLPIDQLGDYLIAVVCGECVVHDMRTNVSDLRRDFGGELTLDIDVPIHRIAAVGVLIDPASSRSCWVDEGQHVGERTRGQASLAE